MIQSGDIILYWSPNSKPILKLFNYAKMQEFFTKYKWRPYNPKGFDGKLSHAEMAYDENYTIDTSWNVVKSLFNPRVAVGNKIYIYSWKDIPKDLLRNSADEIWNETKDKPYAWWQIIYHIRRWFWENWKYNNWWWIFKAFSILIVLFPAISLTWIIVKVFLLLLLIYPHFKPKDVRNWNNWFVKNYVCSETTPRGIKNILSKAVKDKRIDAKKRMLMAGMLNTMQTPNDNNWNVGDIKIVLDRYPDLIYLSKVIGD